MKRLALTGLAAFGFGLSSFVMTTAAEEMVEGPQCYLTGCFNKDGNRVDDVKTASIALDARKAVDAAKAGGGVGQSKIDKIIEKHARANGVPLPVARAVVRIESNYRAHIRGAAGEVGLMQIKPATARMMGYSGSVKGLFDPETNIKYGMKYLGMAQELGDGSICNTILKYNAGHGAKRMNPVSRAYCSKVKQHIAG